LAPGGGGGGGGGGWGGRWGFRCRPRRAAAPAPRPAPARARASRGGCGFDAAKRAAGRGRPALSEPTGRPGGPRWGRPAVNPASCQGPERWWAAAGHPGRPRWVCVGLCWLWFGGLGRGLCWGWRAGAPCLPPSWRWGSVSGQAASLTSCPRTSSIIFFPASRLLRLQASPSQATPPPHYHSHWCSSSGQWPLSPAALPAFGP
jgi:hypothetical protein